MDELRLLRDHHDAQPEPVPQSVADARARLTDHMRRPRAKRRLVRPWALAGAAALALAVAVAINVPGTRTSVVPVKQPSTTHLQLRPVSSAADLAANAAALAAAGTDITLKPTQWVYVKNSRYELWRRMDDKQFATVEGGKVKVHQGSEFEVSYTYLLSLPTDPEQLLAQMYKTVDEEDRRHRADPRWTPPPLTAEQRNAWAFQNLAQGLRDAVLPAKLRAAIYGAMARIPGVGYRDRAWDRAKRPGVTLYLRYGGDRRDEIFLNAKTYEYMGYRTLKKGRVTSWDSLLKAVLVDKPGRR